jgi:hypothetical protein
VVGGRKNVTAGSGDTERPLPCRRHDRRVGEAKTLARCQCACAEHTLEKSVAASGIAALSPFVQRIAAGGSWGTVRACLSGFENIWGRPDPQNRLQSASEGPSAIPQQAADANRRSRSCPTGKSEMTAQQFLRPLDPFLGSSSVQGKRARGQEGKRARG